ncbi:hypothetical protein [Pseudobythopirellula maris]|uniref:hypothetical protein n=1 Tax=Pseudobythopirellula maris TaxID=2527991 RepID=UPI0018D47561|nr:hypothetical protein [Pseudobythopirellula maris]
MLYQLSYSRTLVGDTGPTTVGPRCCRAIRYYRFPAGVIKPQEAIPKMQGAA